MIHAIFAVRGHETILLWLNKGRSRHVLDFGFLVEGIATRMGSGLVVSAAGSSDWNHDVLYVVVYLINPGA
jgi:hypothetical protein